MNLESLNGKIVNCTQCPRLVRWRETVAREKRAQFQNETYWGRPLTGFGDAQAKILIVGLAPAAHGGNRTGRMFTGDRSGDWLYHALHRAGLASQPTSKNRNDGLELNGAYITAIVRCAPPQNKPTPQERDRCLSHLASEWEFLPNVRVIVALGSFAWEGTLRLLRKVGETISKKPKFKHGAQAQIGSYTLLGCYHPSQQNTFTGKLTEPMLDAVFRRAVTLARA